MSEQHDHDRHYDASVYDAKYFSGDGSKSGYTDYAQAEGMVSAQFQIIRNIMEPIVSPGKEKQMQLFDEPAKHLDVGCAYGFGCHIFQEAGWSSIGIDVSEAAIKQGQARYHGSPLLLKRNAMNEQTWNDFNEDSFDLITAVEFFEHIESADVLPMLTSMARVGKYGVFVINARTAPGQDPMANHGDHGHLNNHNMSWWVKQVAEVGEINWEAMFLLNKYFEAYNSEVHWHNRVIVVQFNKS